ncbi:MAG: hypothetical protein M3Q37_07155 [Gemmatimonadota bacterium]|nr:hypothetical protein [Gemmatimonadota bacterium]
MRLGIIACLVMPARVWAQLPPVGVPGGTVRVELGGSLETFDRRFRDGLREPYGADLSSPALGSDRIQSLADADARIGRVIGNPGYRLNLGTLTSDVLADVGKGTFGLGLGLTNRITIFGRIPLVRTRVQSTLALNPATADAGLNPGETGQLPFFQQFDAALSTLSSKLAAGDYNANPAQRTLAEATLAEGTALRSDLFGLLADPATASPVVPTATSGTGAAVLTRIEGLQNTLASSLSVPGFAADPVLPADPLGDDGLRQLLSGPLALRVGQSRVTFRGDAEAGAAVTLFDRWDRGPRRGGFRTAVSGLVRFPTGIREQPDRPLDIGTGNAQTDIQVDLVTDLGAGALGARLAGTYVRQLPANVVARVAPPSQPFVGPERAAMVRRNPGDIIAIDVRPFYRLARTLALQAGIQYWNRTADQVTYASPAEALPGIDPSVLAEGTAANATLLSGGLTYSNPGRFRPGGSGLPVDASWSYERVLRSKKGLVPNTHRVQASLKMYFGLW